MRIGSIFEWKANAAYRAQTPLRALERRGHEVIFGTQREGAMVDAARLKGCDVIHVYRWVLPDHLPVLRMCIDEGAAFVWDTDDDVAAVPKESPLFRQTGALRAQRMFADTVRIAKEADMVTTTTDRLAEKYRTAGIERIEVIGNYLGPEVLGLRGRRHHGVVIGWTAGLEHAAELSRIPIRDALCRVLDVHPDVRVASLGVDLRLPRGRYEHHFLVDFHRLQDHIRRWDIGIAPLSDIAFNRSRSDVKLKEYASVGVPWLASPRGPYAGLGEQEGGRLVADDGWYAALDELVRNRRERRRLARRARAWAKRQSIDGAVDRWERVCLEAVERRASRRGAGATGP